MISRRQLLTSLGGALVAACKGAAPTPASCADTTGLTAEDVGARTTLAYLDRSADPAKSCKLCQQYVEPTTAGACGTCKLLRGPIHPAGTCKAFALKG